MSDTPSSYPSLPLPPFPQPITSLDSSTLNSYIGTFISTFSPPPSFPPLSSSILSSTYQITQLIDHTILAPTATFREVEKIWDEAVQKSFKSVCISTCHLESLENVVRDKEVNYKPKICVVVGFPLGTTAKEIKIAEATWAVRHSATEVDMVISLGHLKSKDYFYVFEEIRDLVIAVKKISPSALVKVIVETCLLTEEEIKIVSLIVKISGADFIKTSTGFSTGGAKEEDVRLMKWIVGNDVGVKASGGVRTLESLKKMVDCGAGRIGTSSGMKIVLEAEGESVPVSGK